jgi:ceramide glucosyltransferase
MFWTLTLFFVLAGTWLAWRKIERASRKSPEERFQGISVLKPLKGVDPGLEKNLESFFQIRYPLFELIFSVADANDPAATHVRHLQAKYPFVRSRLLVGAEAVGLNPKVNNLTRSYREAVFDLLLISDSNIRVAPDYLQKKLSPMREDVGVVTATVAGIEPSGFGGWLETIYLNTFYARGMSLAFASGNPCVIGKSMLFRRSVAERFGGIRALGGYLAEDYALGEEMRMLGLKVVLMDDAISQYVGKYSLRSFWDRHVRWGRIRKAHAPWAFLAEPLFTPIISSGVAAAALSKWLAFPQALLLNLFIWMTCDLFLMRKFSGRRYLWAPLAWITRELLSLPLWLTIAAGNSVQWRGSTLFLAYGGKIVVRGQECGNLLSSGERLPVRTRLRATIDTVTGGNGRPRAILREG